MYNQKLKYTIVMFMHNAIKWYDFKGIYLYRENDTYTIKYIYVFM